MPSETLPPFAAWRHRDARAGFEVVFLGPGPEGHHLEGHTAAVEDGQPWAVRYSIVIDASWTTRRAHVIGQSGSGHHEVSLESDGAGAWLINGASAPQLAGCLDVDLESSSLTNALPVHRLRLAVAQEADAPAAYVRARPRCRHAPTDSTGVKKQKPGRSFGGRLLPARRRNPAAHYSLAPGAVSGGSSEGYFSTDKGPRRLPLAG